MSFGQPDDLLIILDQHHSIKNAIERVYPNISHGLFYYHLSKNLARYGGHVVSMFQYAAYAYRHEIFQKYWSVLSTASWDGAYQKLFKADMQK